MEAGYDIILLRDLFENITGAGSHSFMGIGTMAVPSVSNTVLQKL